MRVIIAILIVSLLVFGVLFYEFVYPKLVLLFTCINFNTQLNDGAVLANSDIVYRYTCRSVGVTLN